MGSKLEIMKAGNYQFQKFEQIAVADSAVAFTSSTYTLTDGTLPSIVVFSVTTGNVRIRMDGTDPTTTVGTVYVKDLKPYELKGTANIQAAKMIRDGSTSAVIDVAYGYAA